MSDLIIIVISLLFSAFFSGMEIAFISLDNFKLEVDLRQNKLSAKIISFFKKNEDKYIATMLVGNNIALVIYGISMAKLIGAYLEKYISNELSVLLIQTIASTLIILFIAEFSPKALFRKNPNKVLSFFAIFVLFFYYIFYPITIITTKISLIFISLLKRGNEKEEIKKISYGRADLNNFIKQFKHSKNVKIKEELNFIKKILDFDKVKAKECMVPRNEIKALEINATVDDVIKLMSETGFSKILIYENSIDNIKGYVHSISLFKNPKSISEMLVEIPIVPETMTAKDVYKILISEHKSIALVVDEYGGTSGIITIEDILEEIFGEIQDEHDKNLLVEQKLEDGSYIFSGRLEIDYLNEKYNLSIPQSGEYETLAGYILEKLERFPEKNEEFVIDNFKIKILEINKPKIIKVKLKKNE